MFWKTFRSDTDSCRWKNNYRLVCPSGLIWFISSTHRPSQIADSALFVKSVIHTDPSLRSALWPDLMRRNRRTLTH